MKSRQILDLILLVSLFTLFSLIASCNKDSTESRVPAETVSSPPQGDIDPPHAEETEQSEEIMLEAEAQTIETTAVEDSGTPTVPNESEPVHGTVELYQLAPESQSLAGCYKNYPKQGTKVESWTEKVLTEQRVAVFGE